MAGIVTIIPKLGSYGDGDQRAELTLSAFLPPDILGEYNEKYGQVTMSIAPATNESTNEFWQTICDFSLDQAIMLRDSLSSFISYLERNPER